MLLLNQKANGKELPQDMKSAWCIYLCLYLQYTLLPLASIWLPDILLWFYAIRRQQYR